MCVFDIQCGTKKTQITNTNRQKESMIGSVEVFSNC